MVCCWFWPAPAPSSKKKKKPAKANTSAPRRRPTSYTSSADGTPLLAPRPAATSSLYSRNDKTYHTTTTNNKRVRLANPNNTYYNPPSPKKPKTKSSKHDSSSKLRGRGTKRGPPKPHPDPHPCASCALHHPGHAHRTAHNHSRTSSHHHHHHYTRSAAPAPDTPSPLLRRTTAPLTGEPGSSTATARAGRAGGRSYYAYGTGPVYSSTGNHNGTGSGGGGAHHHASPPPGAYRTPHRPSRAHARANTAARRSSRRDAPVVDVGTAGRYTPAGPASYGGAGSAAFAVRAATNQALESVRRQAFREQMGRPGAPAPGARRVRWEDEGGRRRGGGQRRGGGGVYYPPYGGLESWK